MSGRTRLAVFLVGATGVAVLLIVAFTGIPGFGHYRGPYGDIINAVALPQRHATSAVTPVVFDYRAMDTMGEEFILFAAVMATSVLLRRQRDETEETPLDRALVHADVETADAVRLVCMGLVAPLLVLGMYIVAHGHLTPGGGFQGGIILGGALVMVYLAGRFIAFRQLSPSDVLDSSEGLGAGAYVAVGFVGMLAGAAFLENVLPLGAAGTIFSAGTMPVINFFVGIEVGAGLLLIVDEFLEQALIVRAPRVS